MFSGDSEGTIFFYRWSDLEEKEQSAKPVAGLSGTKGGSADFPAEVNSLKVTKDNQSLISGGAGDNEIKVWSLEDGKLKVNTKN